MRWPPDFERAVIQDSRIDPGSTFVKNIKGAWVVTWHARVGHPRGNYTVPPVEIHFTACNRHGGIEAKPTLLQEAPLTFLDIFRIGSLWKGHKCIGTIRFDSETFDVSFESGDWTYTTLKGALGDGKAWAKEFTSMYPLKYKADWTWMLAFRTTRGARLFIPCLEFYTSIYGASSELRRILATYPWHEAEPRLFSDQLMEGDENDGSWIVPLGKRLVVDDAKLLAHIKYNPETRNLVRGVYSQLEAARGKWHPLKVQPWWTGKAQLLVDGFWLNDGHDFIGLRIEGSSLPGPHVKVIMPERPEIEPAAGRQEASTGEELECRTHVRNDRAKPLTPDELPDHSGSTQILNLREFKVLDDPCPPRVVRRARTVQSGKRLTRFVTGSDETALSTDKAYGDGKGVGKAILTRRKEMESEGMLRDMWNALNALCGKVPDIHSVRWYDPGSETFRDGEPELVQVDPDESVLESSEASVRRWPFVDKQNHQRRGFLVMRIEAAGGTAFIIEIQRRVIGGRLTSTQKTSRKEESFKGLVFELDDESAIGDWIRTFAREICEETGRMDKVAPLCPGTAFSFKHSRSKKDDVLCEAAALNALGKIGIHPAR